MTHGILERRYQSRGRTIKRLEADLAAKKFLTDRFSKQLVKVTEDRDHYRRACIDIFQTCVKLKQEGSDVNALWVLQFLAKNFGGGDPFKWG